MSAFANNARNTDFNCTIVPAISEIGIQCFPKSYFTRQFPPLHPRCRRSKASHYTLSNHLLKDDCVSPAFLAAAPLSLVPIVLLPIYSISCLFFLTRFLFVQYLFFNQQLMINCLCAIINFSIEANEK